MQHGFRLYVVEAFHNQKKGKDAQQCSVGSPTADEIKDLLERAHDVGTRNFHPPPVPDDSDEPERRVKSVTIRDVTLVRDDLVHFVISHGEQGERPHATRPGHSDQDLGDWSAEGEHIMTLLFSTDESETRFMVASQTVKSQDAMDIFIRLIRTMSLEDKKAAAAEQETDRKQAKDRGEKPNPRKAFHRLVFDYRQAIDNPYLDEIIGDAKEAHAVFEARVPSSRGDGERVQRKLQINLLDEKDRQISSVVGRRWSRSKRDGAPSTQGSGVSELAAELANRDLMDGDEAGEYDTSKIALTGANGASTTIAVDTLRDVFTYPVSEGPPPPYRHYTKVAPRLQIVAAEEGVELALLDPLEIDQCLPD